MKKGIIYVLGCYILWGLFPIYWKLLSDLDPLYILSSRIFWSLIFCLVLLFVGKRFMKILPLLKDFRLMRTMFFVGIAVSVNWGVYIWAVNHDRILDASLGYFMNPLMAVLLGAIVFKEQLTRLEWIAVGTAAIGVIIGVIQSGIFPYVALLIGGSFAIYGAIKKNLQLDGETSITLETLVVIPFAFGYMLFAEINQFGAIGNLYGWSYILIPMMGVVTVVPLLLFAKGVTKIPYSLTGMLIYINPTLQMLLGIWYGEPFTKNEAITFGFIWVGLILFVIASTLKLKRLEKRLDHVA